MHLMSDDERLRESWLWLRELIQTTYRVSVKEVIESRPFFIVTPSDGRRLDRCSPTGGVRNLDLRKYFLRVKKMERRLRGILGPVGDSVFEDPMSDDDLHRIELMVQATVPESFCTRDFRSLVAAVDEDFRRGAEVCNPMIAKRRLWWFMLLRT
jgi:hypothetical protein